MQLLVGAVKHKPMVIGYSISATFGKVREIAREKICRARWAELSLRTVM